MKNFLTSIIFLLFPGVVVAQTTFGDPIIIIEQADPLIAVFVADLDGDEDVDVLSYGIRNSKIVWNENLDVNGIFWNQRFISTSLIYAKAIYPADIDGDGDVDILASSFSYKGVVWYKNLLAETSIKQNQMPSHNNFQSCQNYSNPFNSTTIIYFFLGKGGFVTLKIYDLEGKEIATLLKNKRMVGSCNVKWDANIYQVEFFVFTN